MNVIPPPMHEMREGDAHRDTEASGEFAEKGASCGQPSEWTIARFEDAMGDEQEQEDASEQAVDSLAHRSLLDNRLRHEAIEPTAPTFSSPGIAEVNALVTDFVAALRVEFDSARALEVDMDESLMTGVSIRLEELAGRLQIGIHCRYESSYLQMLPEAAPLATALYERLARSLAVRVDLDGGDEARFVEALAG